MGFALALIETLLVDSEIGFQISQSIIGRDIILIDLVNSLTCKSKGSWEERCLCYLCFRPNLFSTLVTCVVFSESNSLVHSYWSGGLELLCDSVKIHNVNVDLPQDGEDKVNVAIWIKCLFLMFLTTRHCFCSIFSTVYNERFAYLGSYQSDQGEAWNVYERRLRVSRGY